MRMARLVLLFSATFLITALLLQAQVTQNQAADQSAIKALWAKFESGFNRGDWKTCASVFTMDGDRMDSFGQFFRGRVAIERSYVALFSGPYKDGVTSSTVTNMRFITPAAAIIDLDSEVKLPGQPVRLLQ